jgi:hypothetical protein
MLMRVRRRGDGIEFGFLFRVGYECEMYNGGYKCLDSLQLESDLVLLDMFM